MIHFDTETCGLHGPIVFLQWAEDDGPVNLYSPWKEPIIETLKLIEYLVEHKGGVCGFNLAFDWFHICQFYTTLLLLNDSNAILEDCIEEYALKEPEARLGPCLKPVTALDLMLFARKGPYQSTMKRDPIRVRRVPTALAWQVAAELEKRVVIPDIQFARRKDKHAPKWRIIDLKDSEGKPNKDFKDIELKFYPTSALKALAADALKIPPEDILKFDSVSVPKQMCPVDKKRGYAPYALAFGKPGDWNGTWPQYVKYHSDHWTYNQLARTYGSNDVIYLQRLYHHFGDPPPGDDDSILACMVGAVRWHGYRLDSSKLLALKNEAETKKSTIPTAPAKVKWYVTQAMDETEKLVMQGSTKKQILEAVSKMLADCVCLGEKPDCEICKGTGTIPHPAAARAADCLAARKAKYRVKTIEKLLRANRFHASFVVSGTKSNRMSGVDDLNAQGIDHTQEMRECFPFVDSGYIFSAGDFSSFEPTLADAEYDDPALRADLLSGKKVHALFGMELFPDMTYDQICASKGSKIYDFYDIGKKGFLAMIYGGNEHTFKVKLGIDPEIGKKAIENFIRRKYKRIGIVQDETRKLFCSMTQPGGIGSKVVWAEPAEFVEAKSGAKRYFTLENQICKALFFLANKPPPDWKNIRIKVKRRDREQFAHGAVQSALYAAAFNLQAGNMRAAVNHKIQAYGAVLTKMLQRQIWDLQPSGISKWSVIPMNVHDEILTPCLPDYVSKVRKVVDDFLEATRPKVPLIGIEWHDSMNSWADK